jgi:hypothetical protein
MKVGVRGEVEPRILTDVMVIFEGLPSRSSGPGFAEYGPDTRVGKRVS